MWKRFVQILLIIAIVASIILAVGWKLKWWLYDGSVDHIDNSQKLKSSVSEIEFDFGKYNDLTAYGNNIVRYENQQIQWIQPSGDVDYTYDEPIQNPIYKGNGNFLVVGEKDNSRVFVFNKHSLIWKVEIEGKVENVDVNASGYVSVVKAYPGYKSALEIYDPKGQLLCISMRASTSIINAAVLSNNRMAVLNELDTTGGSITSKITYINLSGKEIVKKEFPNTIIFKVRGLNDDKCVAVSSNTLIIIDSKGNEILNTKYNSIIGMEKINDSTIAIADVPQENIDAEGAIVEVINSNGIVKRRFDFVTEIKAINAHNNAIAIISGKKLTLINTSGNIIGGCELEREIMNTCFMDNKQILISSSDKGILCKY